MDAPASPACRPVQTEIDRGTLVQVLPTYTPLGFPVFAVYGLERFEILVKFPTTD